MPKITIIFILSAALLVLTLSGCKNIRDNLASRESASLPTQQVANPSTMESKTSSNSPANSLKPGDYKFTIMQGNLERYYLLHIPKSYNGNSAPLVLAFHGGLGTAEMMAQNYGWIPKSDQEGFIVAFPNGASRLASQKLATWNAGNCCGYAAQSKSDDVGFVKAVVNDIKTKVNIGKIFATGMSNGAMLAQRLACEMSDTFSAIGPVAGTNNFDGCSPKKPISVIEIHGLQDDHVLFNGGCGPKCIVGSETQYVSVPDTIAGWVDRNKCDKNPKRVFENAGAYCDQYTGCSDNVSVKLCVVKDGGHSWPGIAASPNPLETSKPSQSLNATDEIWKFFAAIK